MGRNFLSMSSFCGFRYQENPEATLKRFYPEPENHRICLHPENSQMDDIYVDNCEIQGVAVKVIKDLE